MRLSSHCWFGWDFGACLDPEYYEEPNRPASGNRDHRTLCRRRSWRDPGGPRGSATCRCGYGPCRTPRLPGYTSLDGSAPSHARPGARETRLISTPRDARRPRIQGRSGTRSGQHHERCDAPSRRFGSGITGEAGMAESSPCCLRGLKFQDLGRHPGSLIAGVRHEIGASTDHAELRPQGADVRRQSACATKRAMGSPCSSIT